MNTERPYLSFPPGAISDEPRRVPLLWDCAAALALEKPAGVSAFQDSRVGGGPRSILTAINNRARGTAQFERLGVETLFSVNLLEREASGIVLYAKTREARDTLKNAMGSSLFSFRYRFLSAGEPECDEITCELPVAIHREKPLALVSNKTGKKTLTTFHRRARLKNCSLWESESVYDRFHQVRLHAAEVGLPVLGDQLYCQARSSLEVAPAAELRKVTGDDELFLHLKALRFPVDERWTELEAPYPRRFRTCLKKLRR